MSYVTFNRRLDDLRTMAYLLPVLDWVGWTDYHPQDVAPSLHVDGSVILTLLRFLSAGGSFDEF